MSAQTLHPLRPAEILLVEDDEGDAILTEKALRRGLMPFNLHLAKTGETAVRWLSNGHRFNEQEQPDLILLDLNLPGIQGGEVLEIIKKDAETRRIPVVILTSSKSESDILMSYENYANTYMVKPGDPSIFEQVANTLGDYWFNVALLPPKD